MFKSLPNGYLVSPEEVVVIHRMFLFLEAFPFDLRDVMGGPEFMLDALHLRGAIEATVDEGGLDG